MNPNKVDPSVQDFTMRKEAYKKPEVKTFGSVAKLTMGGSGSRPDGVNNPLGDHGQGH